MSGREDGIWTDTVWNDVHGEKNRTSDLFDATQILDPARTDMPAL